MTNQGIAQMVLEPIIAEMRVGFVEDAVGADLSTEGDELRRMAAVRVALLDEISTRLGGLLND